MVVHGGGLEDQPVPLSMLCAVLGVKSDLSKTVQQLEAERTLSQELKAQLEAIKSEYITAGEHSTRPGCLVVARLVATPTSAACQAATCCAETHKVGAALHQHQQWLHVGQALQAVRQAATSTA